MYNIQVSIYNDFSELSYNKLVSATDNVITYGLEPNTLYYWRVKNINTTTGKESAWSSSCYFTTKADDIHISQHTSSEGYNVIIFETGNNVASTYLVPNGELGSGICVTAVGGDTLAMEPCKRLTC